MTQTRYFDLLDWLENEKAVQPETFFARMQEAYGIAHLLYIDAALSQPPVQPYRLHHTLSPSQAEAFAGLGAPLLTTVLAAAMNAVKPLDWGQLLRIEPKAKTLLALAREFALPMEGLTFPLPSREGRLALLSINIAATHRDWPQFRRLHGRDIHALAAQFHAALLDTRSSADEPERTALTDRERETLAWSAAGKSYWEIATILGISERTVRFFMANARRKLDVVSNAQAVAKAIWEGIIARP